MTEENEEVLLCSERLAVSISRVVGKNAMDNALSRSIHPAVAAQDKSRVMCALAVDGLNRGRALAAAFGVPWHAEVAVQAALRTAIDVATMPPDQIVGWPIEACAEAMQALAKAARA